MPAPTRPISQRDLRRNVNRLLEEARSLGHDTGAIERRMATFGQLWEAHDKLTFMLSPSGPAAP